MVIQRRGWPVLAAFLAVCILFPLRLPIASAQVSSSAELDVLRNLPQDQRDALLNRVLGQGSSLGNAGNIGIVPGSLPSNLDSTMLLQLLRQRAQQENTDNGIPVLEPEDFIIIEIDYKLPPPLTQAALPTASGSPNQGQAAPNPVQLAQAAQAQAQAAAANAENAAQPVNPGQLDPIERDRLDRAIGQIRSKNPYQLSRDGVLYLPGFTGIALAGLTEEKAALRLRSEPSINKLEVRVTRLPLKGPGVEPLKPFGYDLFDQRAALFSANLGLPAPQNYVVGPGDTLNVQLYGSDNRFLTLVVSREGIVNFPGIGPISVAGQPFSEAKQEIESRVARQMIGQQASVSMGGIRGIQIFVVGEARNPGSYTVSGLATITTALYAAGGVTHIGSLRDIQLKRRGAIVEHLDLYELLLGGNTAHDAKLMDGDAIFIPPVGPTVSADGEVRRPAIYEIKGPTDAAGLVKLAGGLTPDADTSRAMLTRIGEDRKRSVLEIDLGPGSPHDVLRNGDALRVGRLRPALDAAVSVEGHAYSTGPFAWREGLRLTQVLTSTDDLQPNADLHYVLIRREQGPDRHISVLSADLAAALQSPGGRDDVRLMPRDRIIVFDKEGGRERVISSLLDQLKVQGNFNQPSAVVRIDGATKSPGEYPLEPDMRVSDLIRAGGSMDDAAFGGSAELTRYEVQNGEARRTELINVDLAAVLRGDAAANIPLRPYDSLSIKHMPEWRTREVIQLDGEVRFPGLYELRKGETLSSVLARAGGLTPYAFPEGSVFMREDLKKREQEQLDLLADRLQGDLSTLALQGAAANQSQAAAALSVGQSLLTQLRTSKAVGRLVINLPEILTLKPGSDRDIVLHDGDRLIVPKQRQEVMVLGEVQSATSHLFRAGLERDDYVSQSGGVTRKADRARIYVVRADGSVVADEGRRWFGGGRTRMEPGDTVVVPLDTERLPALPFWQSITQILYNVAVAVAAVGSFGR